MNLRYPTNKHVIALILLVFISIILFSNTFRNSFIWDDEHLIVDNRYIKGLKHIPFLFTTQYWNHHHPGMKGQYRPVRTVTFALDYYLWKSNPFGYHLSNLLLHILNVILIYFLIYRLVGISKSEEGLAGRNLDWFKLLNPAFLTALFFAAHPIHTESVTWIKNRSDLLSLLFFLLSFLLFIRYRLRKEIKTRILSYSLALFCFILALFSKEMALSLPLVLVLYALCFLPKKEYSKTITKILPFLAVAILYFVFKLTTLGMLISAENIPKIGLYSNILVVLKTIGYYLKLLILPVNLNAERLLSIPKSFLEPAILSSAISLSLLLIIIIKTFKYAKIVTFAILWIFLTLLPASNILFLSGRPIAEQRLYIPSLGFCLLLGMGISKLLSLELKSNIFRNLTALFSIFILTFYSTTLIKRNLDWRNSLSLWSKTAQASPDSVRAYNNLGLAYYAFNKNEEAIALFKKAIEINPDYADVYSNLALAYCAINKNEEAIALYKKAIEINPDYADAYNNLGLAYYAINKNEEAIALYKKAIEINPDYAEPYNNLGLAYYAFNKNEEAIALYKKAIEINPDYAEAYYNLGVIYDQINKNEEAIALYKKAIEINPDLTEPYNNLGLAYYAFNKNEEAIALFKKAIEINPDYADVYSNLALAYCAINKNEEAIALYKKAIEINPDYADAYNNLGLTYYAINKNEEAIALFKKAIEINPNYAVAYNNLSAVYFHNKQYKLAIEYCDRARELGFANPAFLEALKPYREQGQLEQ